MTEVSAEVSGNLHIKKRVKVGIIGFEQLGIGRRQLDDESCGYEMRTLQAGLAVTRPAALSKYLAVRLLLRALYRHLRFTCDRIDSTDSHSTFSDVAEGFLLNRLFRHTS